jgi:hypothetical protein
LRPAHRGDMAVRLSGGAPFLSAALTRRNITTDLDGVQTS